jgi:hypothetical protein
VPRGTRDPVPESRFPFAYRTVTFYGGSFQTLQLEKRLVTFRGDGNPLQTGPTTPQRQRLPAYTAHGLGSSHFARRYSGNHGCFLFLGVLRCFTSPRSPRTPMYSVHDDRALPRPGCPIRTSPDHCLFSGSPKLIAACHVLRRLSTPRHPPIALSSLTINPLSWGTPKDISLTVLHLSKSIGGPAPAL